MIISSIINFIDLKRRTKKDLEISISNPEIPLQENNETEQFSNVQLENNLVDDTIQQQNNITNDNFQNEEVKEPEDTMDNNMQPIEETQKEILVGEINGEELICCKNCGSTIKKDSTKCFFCDAIINDNKM